MENGPFGYLRFDLSSIDTQMVSRATLTIFQDHRDDDSGSIGVHLGEHDYWTDDTLSGFGAPGYDVEPHAISETSGPGTSMQWDVSALSR